MSPEEANARLDQANKRMFQSNAELARMQRATRVQTWLINAFLVGLYTFGAYVCGPSIVRTLIAATHEWQAVLR
jgi:hypothetical protein